MDDLIFLKKIDDVDFYAFKPSMFRLYFNCYSADERPPYFSRIVHKVRMSRELFKSHYSIVYMKINDKVIGHVVVGRGGSRIEMSTMNDIVIGPIWIIPEERAKGYGSKGIRFILDHLDINYEYAYEYIEKENKPSLRTVEKNGFEIVAECNEYGLFKKIRPCINGHIIVVRKSSIENSKVMDTVL